jgi:hypothetical protein
MPPVAVTMPEAARKPAMSAVLISGRTRITGSPHAANRSAAAESNAAWPTATPAEAATQRTIGISRRDEATEGERGQIQPGQPPQGLRPRKKTLPNQIHRNPQSGARRSFRHARPEQPQLSLFDGEFVILRPKRAGLYGPFSSR